MQRVRATRSRAAGRLVLVENIGRRPAMSGLSVHPWLSSNMVAHSAAIVAASRRSRSLLGQRRTPFIGERRILTCHLPPRGALFARLRPQSSIHRVVVAAGEIVVVSHALLANHCTTTSLNSTPSTFAGCTRCPHVRGILAQGGRYPRTLDLAGAQFPEEDPWKRLLDARDHERVERSSPVSGIIHAPAARRSAGSAAAPDSSER